jgi:hypothetical protein
MATHVEQASNIKLTVITFTHNVIIRKIVDWSIKNVGTSVTAKSFGPTDDFQLAFIIDVDQKKHRLDWNLKNVGSEKANIENFKILLQAKKVQII